MVVVAKVAQGMDQGRWDVGTAALHQRLMPAFQVAYQELSDLSLDTFANVSDTILRHGAPRKGDDGDQKEAWDI